MCQSHVNHLSYVYCSTCQAHLDKAVAESLALERLGAIKRAEKDAQLWRSFVSKSWTGNVDDGSAEPEPEHEVKKRKRNKKN